MKIGLLSFLLLSSALMASQPRGHEGNIYQTGTGTITHDGDFMDFTLNFESACFDDQIEASNRVIANVATIQTWLSTDKTMHRGGNISFSLQPISTWRKEANGYGEDHCAGTYYASQTLVISVFKVNCNHGLNDDAVQEFYGQLQQKIWPFMYTHDDNKAYTSATITTIEKGLLEATADGMRVAAKAKAYSKAESDFLAFLGSNFQGTWFLHSADFREPGHTASLKIEIDSHNGAGAYGDTPIPATLKLKPVSISATGNFHFVYNH